jgi:hypothetical protein
MSDRAHEVVAEIKKLAAALGRPPKRAEFLEMSESKYAYETAFGSWTAALQAAGFDSKRDRKTQRAETKAKVNDFFQRDISEVMSKKSEECRYPVLGPYPKILCIGDLHCPFWHEPSINLVYHLIEEIKPEYIVQLGDAYDFFSFSKFPRSPYVIDPGEEIRLAREQLEGFWATINNLAPKAKKYQLKGNHDIRPQRRIIETNCPELEYFFNFDRFFEFDGVETIHCTRTPLVIADIHFIHGFLSGQGRHRSKLLGNVVHGHIHAGGVIKNKVNGQMLWELDCGYLGDPGKKVFQYTAVKETKWTRGVGIIDTFGPSFIPFE